MLKKALRRPSLKVHFGEPEDFLETSCLYNDQLKDEEMPKAKADEHCVKNRLARAFTADDVSMFKHILVETSGQVESYVDLPLAHLAAKNGSLKILQEVVSKPADSINAVSADFEATTPLYWAVKEGHADVTKWLLKHGAFHQPLNVYQDSAVYVAVYNNQVKILDVLKANKCDCNVPNRICDLPLMHAIRTGNIAALDSLIKMGVDIYGQTVDRERFDVEGQKVLHPVLLEAVRLYQTPMLLKHIFDSSRFRASSQQTLLYRLTTSAISYDHVSLVRLLLSYMRGNSKLADLQVEAIKWGALRVLRMLITEKRSTPDIDCAIRFGCIDALQIVVENGAKLNKVATFYICIRRCWETGGGRFPNCMKPHVHIQMLNKLQLLLDHGADMTIISPESKMSPIFFACQSGHLCVLLWLIHAGCDVLSPKIQPQTPLKAALNALFSNFVTTNMLKIAYVLVSYLPILNDPAITLYLNKSKVTISVEIDPQNLHKLRQRELLTQFNEFLIEKSTNPKELCHLCRITILRALGTNAHRRVTKLGLPIRLVQYMHLHDLERLCIQLGNNAWLRIACYVGESCICFKGLLLRTMQSPLTNIPDIAGSTRPLFEAPSVMDGIMDLDN